MAGEGLIIDALNRLANHLARAEQINERLYRLIQQAEAEKTPGESRPTTITVVCSTNPATAFQLMPRNARRQVIGIYNAGPDELMYSNTQFDPTTILQQIGSYMNAVQVGIVPAGGNAAIYATGALWVYNYKEGGNSGAVLSLLETLYKTAGSDAVGAYGHDGLVHGGYGPDGTKALR